jgi:hypothetical protein
MGVNRNVYSHGMMLAVIAVQAVAWVGWWRGGVAPALTHIGLALLGIGLLSYTSYWEPAPPDLRSRKIQMVVVSILVAMLVVT